MNGIDFLFDRINYERRSSLPYNEKRLKLENMGRLLKLLGQPQQRYPIIHIAGTKGKGSVATMLTSILLNSGYRVGTYTSPHMTHVGERFVLNGQPTSEEAVLELIQRIRPVVQELDDQAIESNTLDRPTFFEITTAMAFEYFATQHVDCAVIEVGLGGRLDSTNICRPILSVITSISFDHTKQLGNSLAEIASEKAGIIKENVPVVSGVTEPEPRDAIRLIAKERSAELFELEHDFLIRPHQSNPPVSSNGKALRSNQFQLPIPEQFDLRGKLRNEELNLAGLAASHAGDHQQRNAAVATACSRLIANQFSNISDETIRAGLSSAAIEGRIEVISQAPPIIVDVAHNVASAQALIDTISPALSGWTSTLLYATSRDKDHEGVLKVLLPRFQRAIFTQFKENPRGRDPSGILQTAEKIVKETGIEIQLSCDKLPETALESALKTGNQPEFLNQSRAEQNQTDNRNLICITGSVFIVAELKDMIKARFARTTVLDRD